MFEMIIYVTVTMRTLDIILCRVSILLILRFELFESVVKCLNCLTLSMNECGSERSYRDVTRRLEK